jgi:hypothetical protein
MFADLKLKTLVKFCVSAAADTCLRQAGIRLGGYGIQLFVFIYVTMFSYCSYVLKKKPQSKKTDH